MDDDRQRIIEPVLSTDSQNEGAKLKTVPHFSFHLFISTAISFVGIVLAACWKDSDRCKGYFIMLYLRAAFWIITFLFDHLIKHHHEALRLKGYHEFYRATSVHKGVPLYIVSLWNTTILGVAAFMQHYYGPNFGLHCIEGFLSPVVYITVFCIVETFILGLIHGSYIIRVVHFNRTSQLPDALRGTHSSSGSVGLSQPGSDVTELLEKQADLISYLKDYNAKLNQKLMILNSQLHRPATSTP